MEKTSQYQLNQWAAGDRILREDFNRDNANVEAGLVALGQRVTAEQTAREQAVTAEQAAALREAIGSLPPPERELFIRHYYLDQPVAQIAAVTGQNPATLRGRLMRGRAKLKEMLTKRGVCNE